MNNLDNLSSGLSRQNKITENHLQRLAYVYIRQSSPKQVLKNRESQFNQYQLVKRAEDLGWKRERIQVIDTDQGTSARERGLRNGFKELAAEVSLGHVGIILGYEVSRLARNNSDWYNLLDIASFFNTLIADSDGIYDPRFYNDRLLLGLKGTMSEAELHLLKQRLEAGRMSQVKRGEYRQRLPTGLVRLPDRSVIKDPDDQVRHVIELVFKKYEDLGSCRKVMRWLRERDILLPRRQTAGPYEGELFWKEATDSAIYDMLKNPAYAGAFAYGRRQLDPTRYVPGRPSTGRIKRPMDQWLHLKKDHYPAYISWEQYMANRERLSQNAKRFADRTKGAQGAAGKGSALLQGLVTCGNCGYKMRVAYKSTPRYFCNSLEKRIGGGTCMSARVPSVDEVVVGAFFEAIRPAKLDALEAILEAQKKERDQLNQQWEERLKRARYEANLAERRYKAVDPENRLVAASLESNWEEKLVELQQTQEAYERFQQTPPPSGITPKLKEQFENISERLPQLWPDLSNVQKKELLRCLISRVILKKEKKDTVEVRIVWVSGHYSVLYAKPPIHRLRDVSNYDKMVERIRIMWEEGLDDKQIAKQLRSEGFRSARSLDVSPNIVSKIRNRHGWHLLGWKVRNALEYQGYLTARGLAQRLGVKRSWVYSHIHDGTIDPSYITRHPQGRYHLIHDDPELIEKLKHLKKYCTKGGI